MRIGRFVFLTALAVGVLFAVFSLTAQLSMAAAAKAPDTLLFKAKTGNVTFLHAAHAARLKGDCKVCHAKLFTKDATAPLGYKAGMHKPAEKAKTSCGACHFAGGQAFATAGNCKKCHVK